MWDLMMKSVRQRALCGAALTLFCLTTAGSDALAQGVAKPAPAEDPAEVSELVVTGTRAQPGAVVGDVRAEVQISPAEIRAMGVTSAASLLAELAPQLRSTGGRRGGMPIVLVGGRRVSGFNEIRDLPSEAILRVDILPAEAALKFGYPADQRVINFVLRPRFRAKILELQGGAATRGGLANESADLGYLKIMGENRLNLNLKVAASDRLTEAERDLAPATPPTTLGLSNLQDLRTARSLSPQTRSASLNAVYSHTILGGLATTLNATLETSSRQSRLGLPLISLSVPALSPFNPGATPQSILRYVENNGPLIQSNQGWTGHLGGAVNKDQGKWRLSATGAFDHVESRIQSDSGLDPTVIQAALNSFSTAVDPRGTLADGLIQTRADNTARARSDTGNVQVQAAGPLVHIPAGDVRLSLNLGDTETRLVTSSFRSGTRLSGDFSRSAQLVQGNIDIPIASANGGGIQNIGALSVNLNGNVTPITGFGTLTSIGYGTNWNPMTGVNLIISQNQDHNAPTLQQIGDPLVATSGVRVFDYATGKTVDITRLDGGNSALKADNRKTLKIGLTYRPLPDKDLTFSVNYAASRNSDITGSLPAATAQVEAAFPGRFVRNATGDLISIDNRPVNFAEEDRRELKLGLNYSQPVGPQPAPSTFLRPPGGPGAGGARPSGGPPGGF
ncbi:MAG: TonB-dependent receptor, partial [Phenylobacterium zucineum]